MDNVMEKCKFSVELIVNSKISNSKLIFRDLCNSIAELITSTSAVSMKKPNLFLYFNQILDCLRLLARILSFEYDKNIILKECRKSVHKRILFCLDKIETNSDQKSTTDQLGCFLKWMNEALRNIKNISIELGQEQAMKEYCEVKILFENILTNALTVAQICSSNDGQAIKGCCQSVLHAMEELETSLIKTPNKAMIKLFIDNCGDKLCNLERKVDVEILKLCLQVFSKNKNPLDNIFDTCDNNLLEDFDLYMDRLMQIGLFAVFCSTNVESGVNLLNSLANLEYFEQELLPYILIMHKSNDEICKIYKTYFEDQKIKLKQLLYDIIDVKTFCYIICEEIGIHIDKIQENSKENYTKILDCSEVLLDFMSRNQEFNDEIQKNIEKLHLVTNELSKAIEILDEKAPETHPRLLKRCKILKAQLKKLILTLGKHNCENYEQSDNEYSMSLNSLDQKGKNNLKNRSILYRTHENEDSENIRRFCTNTIETRETISFRSKIKNSTTGFNITAILNEFSQLSI